MEENDLKRDEFLCVCPYLPFVTTSETPGPILSEWEAGLEYFNIWVKRDQQAVDNAVRGLGTRSIVARQWLRNCFWRLQKAIAEAEQ